jgi:hypothetical protein
MVDRAIALAVLTSAVALACGGRVATQATDGGGASDAETTTDGALCPPHDLNACVMCTDGFYKCGEDGTPEVPACPLTLANGDPCTSTDTDCINCSGTMGRQMTCSEGIWHSGPTQCE